MNVHIKQEVINKLYNAKGSLIRQVDSSEYATTCPFCAHTSNTPFKLRFYLHIDLESNEPIKYLCFRCQKKGYLNYNTLELLLEGQDLALKEEFKNMKFTDYTEDKMTKFQKKKVDMNIRYHYDLPKVKYGKKLKYIEDRLGIKLTPNICKKLKIITSLREFLYVNNLHIDEKDRKLCLHLENNCVGFLCTSASYILFREINKYDGDSRWFKYRINKKLPKGSLMYSIESPIDIFGEKDIYVNITEGVMDIISIYSNLGYNAEQNVLNIAIGGKYYKSIINYIISRGIVGGNVILNIFSDADHRYKEGVYDTTLGYYKKQLNKYTYLFKEVNIIYNLKKKDFGYSSKDIIQDKHKL